MALPQPVNDVIAHFLTDFSWNHRACKLEDYVRSLLCKRYSPDYADELLQKYLSDIVNVLMDEYEARVRERDLLRYKIIDDNGEKVAGIGSRWQNRLIVFQDALNALTHAQFESLSARVLGAMGCSRVWVTPESHDQGLDSFGYGRVFSRNVPLEVAQQCPVVFLVQAKHYTKEKIGTRDIREFIGSYDLAVHKIYSTQDEIYVDLTLQPFGPAVLVFMTTQEIPKTVKRLAAKTGVVVMASQEICSVMIRSRLLHGVAWQRRALKTAMSSACRQVRVAR